MRPTPAGKLHLAIEEANQPVDKTPRHGLRNSAEGTAQVFGLRRRTGQRSGRKTNTVFPLDGTR